MIFITQTITLVIMQVTVMVIIQSMATISTSEEPFRDTMLHQIILKLSCTETHAYETDLKNLLSAKSFSTNSLKDHFIHKALDKQISKLNL